MIVEQPLVGRYSIKLYVSTGGKDAYGRELAQGRWVIVHTGHGTYDDAAEACRVFQQNNPEFRGMHMFAELVTHQQVHMR